MCCQVEDNREYRVHVIMPIVASSVFRNSRSVLVRRTLPKGRYVVVVSTFEPGVIGSFLFRCYTGSPTKVRQVMTLYEPNFLLGLSHRLLKLGMYRIVVSNCSAECE